VSANSELAYLCPNERPYDMSPSGIQLRVGDLYSNDEIQTALNVGNAGGIRVRLDDSRQPRRIAILTSSPDARQQTENPYGDRIEGDILVYTAGGREGDQTLAGINKRVPEQLLKDFPIYGFQIIESRRTSRGNPKRWRFIGLLEYIRHYPDTELDVRKQLRHVWIFEFRIHVNPSKIIPEQDQPLASSLLAGSRQLFESENEERDVSLSQCSAGDTHIADDPIAIESERSNLLSLPPEKFEHLVKDLLIATGFEKVAVTRYSQDGGIDVTAHSGTTMWPLKDMFLQVQAKRWRHTVGRKEVAQLRGSLKPFARGALVTTSHFSNAAINESVETGKMPIVLVNGYTFASLVRSYRPQLPTLAGSAS
jgi:hypothetical protein